ncbi:MAG: hypothetical protein JXA20_06350 [Spirochaetes bacterium]|nr:hypothetical protein [Spirochaetota bacterium]
MKNAMKVFLVAALVVTAGFTTSCFEDSSNDPVTVKIISESQTGTDNSITGYIIADDSLPYSITDIYSSGGTHYTQIDLDDIEQVYISTEIGGSSDANVTIMIYRRTNDTDVKVKETTTSVTGSTYRTVTLSYEYGEEESSTDSDSSSS